MLAKHAPDVYLINTETSIYNNGAQVWMYVVIIIAYMVFSSLKSM